MTTDNFCFYLQNRLIQISEAGGHRYSDTSPLLFPRQSVTVFELHHQLQGKNTSLQQISAIYP